MFNLRKPLGQPVSLHGPTAPSVVVTGVSSGIGRAVAKDLLDHGYQVFGSVRTPADATRLTEVLGGRFSPLLFDLTDEQGIRRAAAEVEAALAGRLLAGLVNNAGGFVGGPLLHQPLAEVLENLRVHAVGTLAVSQAFLPLLGARRGYAGRPGRLVNISSVGGKIVTPFASSYQAAKHALEALSDGLRRELVLYGIEVIVVRPGAIRTAILDKLAMADYGRYSGTDYAEPMARFFKEFLTAGRVGHPPQRVAEVVRNALTARRPRLRYTVVRGRLFNWDLPRLLPDRWLDRLLARRFGLDRLINQNTVNQNNTEE